MAGGRRSHGQGTFWGDLIGPNPTGPWQGWYQAQSPCGWRGRPLEHCGCGSKRARCQAVGGDPWTPLWSNDHSPTEEEPQHLCLDKGYDNPSGRGAAAGHGYREHIRRIGEEKLDASGDKRYPARRWVVERTLAWLSK